jgi:hypothetical protein
MIGDMQMREVKTWKSWIQELAVLGLTYIVFFALIVNSTFFGTGYFTIFLVAGALLLGTGYFVFLGLSIIIKVNKLYSTILACTLIAVIAVAYVGTVILTSPKWKLRLETNKPTYDLGENVVITATLENQGYFSQSFSSAIANPVQVSVNFKYGSGNSLFDSYSVWYSPTQWNESTFTVPASQTLTRTFVWNQTNTVWPKAWNTTYTEGRYFVYAFVPINGEGSENSLAEASLFINVTGT